MPKSFFQKLAESKGKAPKEIKTEVKTVASDVKKNSKKTSK